MCGQQQQGVVGVYEARSRFADAVATFEYNLGFIGPGRRPCDRGSAARGKPTRSGDWRPTWEVSGIELYFFRDGAYRQRVPGLPRIVDLIYVVLIRIVTPRSPVDVTGGNDGQAWVLVLHTTASHIEGRGPRRRPAPISIVGRRNSQAKDTSPMWLLHLDAAHRLEE